MPGGGAARRTAGRVGSLLGRATAAGTQALEHRLGGAQRTRVVVLLAAVLGLAGADVATVGASATQLRDALHITNTDIGLLVAVSSLVGAAASLPAGALADRVPRTRVLGLAIVLWGGGMISSATGSRFWMPRVGRPRPRAGPAGGAPLVRSLVR